ncbi:hypothetical protein NA57DRAFT_54632 [Rhizodiscina lignyota]|uniref:Clr5 domain-containing protein n=1 Tax=Rhizodiscina lignyota TaxID=1504668 RepID=A0A9P4MCD8_9PEZI|nr:hypothetical protein NA57DRAFT_54632 [Rhizodiscina lignyota]
MNSDRQELIWVGPSNPRAKRLPQKSWEGYKEELFQLYQMMTLDELMEFMSLRHDFGPSRRQYIFQFRKWGFRKYGNPVATSTPSAGPAKRSPPSSTYSAYSTYSTSVVHAPKRRELSPAIEVKDPFHGLGLPFDTIHADEHHVLSRHPDDYRAPALNDFEEWAKGQRRINDPDASSIHVDISQDIDDFSDENIYEMKRTADFLYAMSFPRDAFVLYVLILKRLRASPNCPDWMILWATIACARTAWGSGEFEIARSLLKQRLDCPSGSACQVDQFVMRMLLADTYARISDFEAEKMHIQAALRAESANETLISALPQDHRTFDLWTYHFLTREFSVDMDQPPDAAGQNTPYSYRFNNEEARRMLLHLKPGPFEIENGVMMNPVLRSCLQWTKCELSNLAIDPHLCEYMDGMTHSEAHKSAQAVILFCAFWERWHSGKSSTADDLCVWTTKAEKLMGISACQVLIAVVFMVLSAAENARVGHHDKGKLGNLLIDRAQAGSLYLSSCDDVILARCFLLNFSAMERYQGGDMGDWTTFRAATREYAKGFL